MEHRNLEDLALRVKPRTATTILLWAMVAFVVVFFIWAGFAELERTVRAQGRVVPNSQLQIVSNHEGGIVEAILVEPGEEVDVGQELIRLDPTQTGADLGSGQALVSALQIKSARLEAEVQGRTPVFPAAGDATTAEQVRIERALHASRMADLASLGAGAQARVAQAERSAAEAGAMLEARNAAREARTAEAELLQSLVERGIEPRLTLMQAESAANIASREAAAAAASLARAQAGIAEARASAARVRQEWRALAANELASTQAELAVRRSAMPALTERANRTVVRSPLAGRINRVLVTTIGGSVAPGAPLVEIVPGDENLLVEARVRPQDIAFIHLGQRAKVEVTAYDPSVYGGLEAEVVAISPDAVPDEQSGETFYIVRVRTAENVLRSGANRALPIGPGMVANVSLIGDTRTVLDYLLSPITKLRDSALRE
ncbi:HlyD family type I secretion periplasmic adaptor subunit [Qipengyuania sp. DY56-A-20]|jgi:adhesin transport system membrane fusion protein|uniref:Membrane fusion protein (MFP) family protein n=1 Tax=Qipengyuania benthica TaxID=3067651 RepID=A0ABT9H9F6_9SPHN|nr:HlyD family type I secretion periplasmic adaptor subunit [Qipengyuania sp. DY56-A-20]MDP4539954.1 HlyD family type I secretion periplasmic adaptor subunit [Qipengyuania sp. DY56-A-20]